MVYPTFLRLLSPLFPSLVSELAAVGWPSVLLDGNSFVVTHPPTSSSSSSPLTPSCPTSAPPPRASSWLSFLVLENLLELRDLLTNTHTRALRAGDLSVLTLPLRAIGQFAQRAEVQPALSGIQRGYVQRCVWEKLWPNGSCSTRCFFLVHFRLWKEGKMEMKQITTRGNN